MNREQRIVSISGNRPWATYPHLFTIHYHLFPDMEVGGVEPPSETASTKLLRVYPAFDLARGMPTGGLIPKQPFGYTNCDARAESFAASPAELCRGGLAGVCRATSGPMLGRESVIVVRDYGFAG